MYLRFGSPPENGRVYKRRPGAYALLLRDDQILLTEQTADSLPEPEIQLPGGGIDPGESPVHALHREVFEETGWSIGQPVCMGMFRRFTYMPEYDLYAEKICTIYVARPALRLGPPLEQGHRAVWMGIDAAKRELTPWGPVFRIAGI